MTQRFSVVTAVHILLLQHDAVLLARRANTGYEDGKWSVPAGHLDGEETVRAAAVREAREEVGVRLVPEQLRFGHVMHRRDHDHERIDFFLAAPAWQGEVTIAEPDKCSELAWVEPGQLPEDVVPYVRSGIADVMAGNPYSEFGWR